MTSPSPHPNIIRRNDDDPSPDEVVFQFDAHTCPGDPDDESATWDVTRDHILRAIQFDTLCPMAVTRGGDMEPCDQTTVAMIGYVFEGDVYVSAVCRHHATPKDRVIPLHTIVATATRGTLR